MQTKIDPSILATMLRERYEAGELSRAEYDSASEDLQVLQRRMARR